MKFCYGQNCFIILYFYYANLLLEIIIFCVLTYNITVFLLAMDFVFLFWNACYFAVEKMINIFV